MGVPAVGWLQPPQPIGCSAGPQPHLDAPVLPRAAHGEHSSRQCTAPPPAPIAPPTTWSEPPPTSNVPPPVSIHPQPYPWDPTLHISAPRPTAVPDPPCPPPRGPAPPTPLVVPPPLLMNGAMQGAVLAPAVDHAVPLQPSVVAPLAQQLGHLSLGSTGTVRTPPAATPPLPPTTPSPTDTSSPPSMCLLPPCLEPSSHRTPQCHPRSRWR